MDFDQVNRALRKYQELRIEQAERAIKAVQSSGVERALNVARELFREIGPELLRQALRASSEFASEFGAAMPDNWQRLTNPEIFDAVALMKDTGWSLVWTPPADTISALLNAEDRDAQRAILLGAEGRIIVDLDRQLERIDDPDLGGFRQAVRESLEAYRSGYFKASQALAAAILSSVIHEHFEESFGGMRRRFRAAGEQDAPVREFRWIAVQSALVTALGNYDPLTGKPERPDFNRHASAHRVLDPQYRQVNALTALMLLVSLLVEQNQLSHLPADGGSEPL